MFVALATLAACSGGGTSDATTAPSCTSAVTNKGCFGTCDSCSLLTSALASSGVDVALNAGDNGGNPRSCDWEHLDASGVPDVQVIVESNINAQTFEKLCHPANHGSNDAGIIVTPASGVGDDACYVQAQGLGGPALTFLKGCWAYTISIVGPSSQFPDATVEMEEARIANFVVPMI
ncbi:MAG TPA: hypothetical protein VH560_05460 [Polyangia bacterium]|jgi:hypothetical protein|nr:hypothetical protein [Polyangia bacterium]